MAASQSLIAELEAAVHAGSPNDRIETLHRLADVLLGHDHHEHQAAIVTLPHSHVRGIRQGNSLNETAILEYARAGKYEDVVAALSHLCSAPSGLIERLIQSVHCEALLILCKAAELKWSTVDAILTSGLSRHPIGLDDLEQAKSAFIQLSVATAQRALRFLLVRGNTTSRTS